MEIPSPVFGSFDRRLPEERVEGEWPKSGDALEAARKYLEKTTTGQQMKSSVTISKTKRGTSLDKQVEAWNAKVKIGGKVEYREYPEAEPQVFTTHTEAEILSGHTVVVWLNGKAGCVCVDACKPIAE